MDKAKEQSLDELGAQIRVMAKEADEQKWGQFIKEGVYKKWFHPEERWFVEFLITKKILPKLIDPKTCEGRKDTFESNLARLLVLFGQGCKLVPGATMTIYSDGVALDMLGQLSPKEQRVLENTKRPKKVIPTGGYDGEKLSRAYIAASKTYLDDPLAGLCSKDSWEVGIRWRTGFREKVDKEESLSVARALGWYDGDVTKAGEARKRVNQAVNRAGLSKAVTRFAES